MEGKTKRQDLYSRLKTEDSYEIRLCIILGSTRENKQRKNGKTGERKSRKGYDGLKGTERQSKLAGSWRMSFRRSISTNSLMCQINFKKIKEKIISQIYNYHLNLIAFTCITHAILSWLFSLPGVLRAASCPHQANVVPEPGQCSWQ